jgi:hypothetical protein
MGFFDDSVSCVLIMIVQISLVNCRIIVPKNAAVDKTRTVSEIGG